MTITNVWRRWLSLLFEVWVFGVIVAFFVVRVLGSNAAKEFLHRAGY